MNGIRIGAGSGTDPDNKAIREIAKQAKTQGKLTWAVSFRTSDVKDIIKKHSE